MDEQVAREHLAVRLAWKTWERLRAKWQGSAHVDDDAVRGAAMLGAAKALRQFDPGRGCQFRSYAIALIRGEMQEELRRQDHLPRSLRQRAKRIEAQTGERPRWAEPPRSIEEITWRGEDGGEFGNDPLEQLEQLAAEHDTEAEALERIENAELWQAVDRLPCREGYVLRRRYQHGETASEIGERLGRADYHVDRLQRQGIARLRRMLGAERGG